MTFCVALLRCDGQWLTRTDRTCSSRADAVDNVTSKLLVEHVHHADHRHRRDLTETAQGELDDVFAGATKQRQIVECSAPEPDAIEDLDQSRITAMARYAFRARLDPVKCSQVSGEI